MEIPCLVVVTILVFAVTISLWKLLEPKKAPPYLRDADSEAIPDLDGGMRHSGQYSAWVPNRPFLPGEVFEQLGNLWGLSSSFRRATLYVGRDSISLSVARSSGGNVKIAHLETEDVERVRAESTPLEPLRQLVRPITAAGLAALGVFFLLNAGYAEVGLIGIGIPIAFGVVWFLVLFGIGKGRGDLALTSLFFLMFEARSDSGESFDCCLESEDVESVLAAAEELGLPVGRQ